MKTKMWLAMLAIMLAGCVAQDPFTLENARTRRLITNVSIKPREAGVDEITLTYLGGRPCTLMALDAAQTYQRQLHVDEAVVYVRDPGGQLLDVQSCGAPPGYHEEQTGIEYRNGPFGPTDIYPTYGPVKDYPQ
jgi:hypothetical protein